MHTHTCEHCGEWVESRRWAKGKRLCPECGTGQGLRTVYLQHVFFSLTLQQKEAILAPYIVDSSEWTALPSQETPSKE